MAVKPWLGLGPTEVEIGKLVVLAIRMGVVNRVELLLPLDAANGVPRFEVLAPPDGAMLTILLR